MIVLYRGIWLVSLTWYLYMTDNGDFRLVLLTWIPATVLTGSFKTITGQSLKKMIAFSFAKNIEQYLTILTQLTLMAIHVHVPTGSTDYHSIKVSLKYVLSWIYTLSKRFKHRNAVDLSHFFIDYFHFDITNNQLANISGNTSCTHQNYIQFPIDIFVIFLLWMKQEVG